MRERYSSKKKLGVLVSSLALVAVTAMAGVTGTAAWFTATRAKSVSTTTFTAVNPNGSLEITAAPGIGTAVADESTTVKPAQNNSVDNVLTDASYDILNHKLYSDYVTESTNDSTSGAPTAFEDVSDHLKLSTTTSENTAAYQAAGTISSTKASYFYAFTWSYNISLPNDNSGKNSYVYFDPSKSSVTATTGNTNILPGFRLAIDSTTAGATAFGGGVAGQTDGHAMIFSQNAVTGTENYIASTTGTKHSYAGVSSGDNRYDAVTKYKAGDESTLHGDGEEYNTAKAYGNYLGQISSSNKSITVMVTAWFEGQDPAVVNSYAGQACSATLAFYVRTAK